MDAAKLDSIVRKIYNGAAGRLPWDVALDEVAQGADAWAVHFVGFDKHTGGVVFSHHGGHATPQTNLDYIRTYHRIDPRGPIVIPGPTNTWFHCHDHFDDRYVASSPFYQDFLIPYGGRYVTLSKIVDDDELAIILGIHRGSGKTPVDSETLHWLTRFRSHMVESMSIYRHMRSLHLDRIIGRHVLDRFVYPVLLVDALRGIVFQNQAAKTALEAADYIVNRNGALGCRHPDDNAALTVAIQNLALDGDGPACKLDRRQNVRIRRASDLSRVSVFLSALRPKEVMGTFGTSGVALLVIHDPHSLPRADPFILAEAFGLTPAEARVAVELSNGKTVEQVASERAVALETVRTQIKALFLKTGLRRQSDLVRLITSLPQL